jgi:hypothetical protein
MPEYFQQESQRNKEGDHLRTITGWRRSPKGSLPSCATAGRRPSGVSALSLTRPVQAQRELAREPLTIRPSNREVARGRVIGFALRMLPDPFA